MKISDIKLDDIVDKCRRIGWRVERSTSSGRFLFTVVAPNNATYQLRDDGDWLRSVAAEMDSAGFARAWQQYERAAQQRARDSASVDNASRDKAKQHAAALALAAGELGVQSVDMRWLLTPSPIMQTRNVIMTPDAADAVLRNINNANRPYRSSAYWHFVNAIRNREWGLTHQGIAVDRDGALQDGQHRLMAMRDLDVALPVQVTVGCDPDSFARVDTGVPRNARDVAAMRGEANASALTAAARLILQYDEWGPDLHLAYRSNAGSPYRVDRAIRDMGDELREAVKRAQCIRKAVKGMNPCGLAAGIYIIGRQMPLGDRRLERFLNDVERGEMLERHDPAFRLRELAISARARGARGALGRVDMLALIIKAWNKRASGQPVRTLMFRRDERFPVPMLPPPAQETT